MSTTFRECSGVSSDIGVLSVFTATLIVMITSIIAMLEDRASDRIHPVQELDL